MRVSTKWLRELVDVDLTTAELVDRLDMSGTAVESVISSGEALDHVVVGHIMTRERHPEADKLWVTAVDVGDGTPRQIVCGAQNFEAGDKVPVALVGAVLPNGMVIKKAKLRGIVSEGMNCSARELGLGEDHEGLMILPEDAPVGMAFSAYQDLADEILELEVTPNRPDCLSMAGVAREVGAILDLPAKVPSSIPAESGEDTSSLVSVKIEDPDGCPRYAARVIRSVRVGPSPAWLAEKVTAAGARSINNIVDVTNYIMFELGQPLHAFDLDKLAVADDGRAQVIVRRAQDGERITTLDDAERVLSSADLLITDPDGPIALAGVMGGSRTEVSDSTVNIFLESASFDPAAVSRTSRSLGLVSESSLRFERGVDRVACVAAVDRAAALMAEVGGGSVASGIVDEYPRPYQEVLLVLRAERLAQVLGVTISMDEAARILERLGCRVRRGADALDVAVPSFRPDLGREVDLIEEVLRVWGMERVASTLPAGPAGGLTPAQKWRARIGLTLRGCGLNETMTYSFADPSDPETFSMPLVEGELQVELLNPMSTEQAVLRTSILPGLVRSVSSNQRHGVDDVHLYEMGTVFFTSDGRKQPKERRMTTAVLAGAWNQPRWNDPATPLDFFDGKGVIENLAFDLGIKRLKFGTAEKPWLQPGRSAEVLIGGNVVGWLGEVHPRVLAAAEAVGPVVAFELDTDALVRAASDVKPFSEPPRYPAVELDLAIVVDESVTAERVEQSVRSAGGKLLEDVRLFDVYRGPGVEDGKKSMAMRLVYRAADRTLTAEEIDTAHARLVRKVTGALGGEMRA